VEICISDGVVSPYRASEGLPMTHSAIRARTIASHLSPDCRRAGAKVVHNLDTGYTGIRFEPKWSPGPVVLEIPTDSHEPYRLIQEFIEPDEQGRTEKEILHFANVYKPSGVALMTRDALKSRGLLSAK